MMEAGWSARRVARQTTLDRSVIAKTSTSSPHRRPSQANCLIGRCPDLHCGHLCLLEPSQSACRKNIWYRGAHNVCCLSHTSTTPPFEAVSCTMGLDCNGMEPGRLQRRI
ncbi:hypothetical protein TNCV_989941 [Trichonephila clavipes]|nr:hypothetical protein TNCV_989941 [Trichonephila clavipes]